MTRTQTQRLRNYKVKYLSKAVYGDPDKLVPGVCKCCGSIINTMESKSAIFQHKLKSLLEQYE